MTDLKSKMVLDKGTTIGARKMIEEERRRLLYDAFSEAADEGDVAFASAAQSEVLDEE